MKLIMPTTAYRGSTLDSFLEAEVVLVELMAVTDEEVVAWQLAKAVRERKISKRELAS